MDRWTVTVEEAPTNGSGSVFRMGGWLAEAEAHRLGWRFIADGNS